MRIVKIMKKKIVKIMKTLAMQLANFSCLPMAMKAAVEFDVLPIIANAGDGVQLSPTQIVAHIPMTNPEAAITLHRILTVLASHSVLSCSVTRTRTRRREVLWSHTSM